MHEGESHDIGPSSPRLRTSDAAGMLAAHGQRSRHMAASASPVQPCSKTYDSARCAPARMVSSSAVTTCEMGVRDSPPSRAIPYHHPREGVGRMKAHFGKVDMEKRWHPQSISMSQHRQISLRSFHPLRGW
jgi:hypothetical protein